MTDAVEAQWKRVCRADAVRNTPVACTATNDSSKRPLCVLLDNGFPRVMLDRCPHRDVALSGGLVTETELVCPGHFWRFDLKTGQRSDLPAITLTMYASRVVDGWVEALLPASPPMGSMREQLLAAASQARETGAESAPGQ